MHAGTSDGTFLHQLRAGLCVQMSAFRGLRYEDGTNLVNNFRPPQALANRKV